MGRHFSKFIGQISSTFTMFTMDLCGQFLRKFADMTASIRTAVDMNELSMLVYRTGLLP